MTPPSRWSYWPARHAAISAGHKFGPFTMRFSGQRTAMFVKPRIDGLAMLILVPPIYTFFLT